MRVALKSLVLLLILGGLILIAVYFGGEYWFSQSGPEAISGNQTVVVLERGLGVNGVAQRLKSAGVIRDARLFSLWVRFKGQGGKLKAGEYAVPSKSSMAEILSLLKSGKIVLHKLTIAEGLTAVQVLRLVKANDVLTGEVSELPAEGSLLPETYEFPRGETRREFIAKMRKAHDDILAQQWPKRQPDLPFETPQEAIALASIVEKETALPAERPRVAAVYINRLRRHMLLQSDPSVIYGITKGEPLGHGLRQSELDRVTPYNTYKVPGLPPTPIANPGKASVEAALNPSRTNELYFVADGSGGHVFATTLAEHEANVKKWRKVERLQSPTPELRRSTDIVRTHP